MHNNDNSDNLKRTIIAVICFNTVGYVTICIWPVKISFQQSLKVHLAGTLLTHLWNCIEAYFYWLNRDSTVSKQTFITVPNIKEYVLSFY